MGVQWACGVTSVCGVRVVSVCVVCSACVCRVCHAFECSGCARGVQRVWGALCASVLCVYRVCVTCVCHVCVTCVVCVEYAFSVCAMGVQWACKAPAGH